MSCIELKISFCNFCLPPSSGFECYTLFLNDEISSLSSEEEKRREEKRGEEKKSYIKWIAKSISGKMLTNGDTISSIYSLIDKYYPQYSHLLVL